MINIQTIHAAKNGDEDAMQQIFREFKQLILLISISTVRTKKYF